jgi:hypothetical protein
MALRGILQSCRSFGHILALILLAIKKPKHFSHTKIFNELIDYLVSGKINRSGRYHQSMVEIAATLWANRLRQLVAMG